jgi:hypothetical protein
MSTCIYDKTDKGREEIATRKYQVPPKLRTLLVMIDGRHTLESLLKNFAVLGLSKDNVDDLERQGLIALISGGEPAKEAEAEPAQVPRPPASARARTQARAAARQGMLAEAQREAPPRPVAETVRSAPADQAERFGALYDFFNQTIKSTIGLRGFALQLRVEKASSVDDFRALRLAYLQAVLKAKGSDTAAGLRERLDDLLGGAPESDDFALPGEKAAAARSGFNYFSLASDSVNFSES